MRREETFLMGDALARFLGNDEMVQAIRFARVHAAWDAVVGPMVVKATMKRVLDGGTLTVYLNSSVLRMQMEMNKDTIVFRLNKEIGENLVQTLILK